MDELELVRLHEDGERLVLAARDGAQSTLPITDALRAAIRGDRPRLESIRAQEESSLRPREIQARLRAGETCEQLAEASGLPIDHVRRFEYPVLSEREHSISRVRAKAVLTEDDGATTLGEVADERLRSRGVRPDDARWSATREGSHPWIVQVEFEAAERSRLARWALEPRGGFVTALDDEARWLGLPEDSWDPDGDARPSEDPPWDQGNGPALAGVSALTVPDDTDLLLDNLSERRGQRPARRTAPDAVPDLLEPDHPDASDAPEENGLEPAAEPADEPSAAVVDIGARRGGSRQRMPSVEVPDSPADLERAEGDSWEVTPSAPGTGQDPPADSPPEKVPEKPPVEQATKRTAARRGRKSRAQVPSWDEIVFGSRPEV